MVDNDFKCVMTSQRQWIYMHGNQFYLIVGLYFLSALASILAEIYGSSLFLSSYPSYWLSYFFIANVVVNITFFSTLTPIIERKGFNFIKPTISSLLLLLFILVILRFHNLFWIPFVVATSLTLIFPLLSIICFKISSDCLSIRDLKQSIIKFRISSSCAVILAAIITPLVINIFGSESLLYIIIILVASVRIWIISLHPKQWQEKYVIVKKKSLWHYPLVKVLLPISLFISIGASTSDYLLKVQLAQELNREQIAEFLGYVLGTAYAISLIIQIFFMPYLLNKFNVHNFFYIAPAVILFGILSIYFFPILIVFSIYRILMYLSYYSFYLPIFDITIASLPVKARQLAKTVERGFVDPSSEAITALLFIAIGFFTQDIHYMIAIILFVSLIYCVPWFYLGAKVKKLYETNLEKGLRLRPFSLESDQLHSITDKVQEEIALKALEEKNFMSGFLLLSRLKNISTKAVKLLIDKFSYSNEFVQLSALKCFENKKTLQIAQLLIDQVEKDISDNLLWEIIKFLNSMLFKEKELFSSVTIPSGSMPISVLIDDLRFNNKELMNLKNHLLSIAKKNLSLPMTPRHIYFIPIALQEGDQSLMEIANEKLKDAFKSEDPNIMIGIARILSEIPIGSFKQELKHLISSTNKEVITQAIQAIGKRGITDLTPLLISHMCEKPIVQEASSIALQSIGEYTVPELLEQINSEKRFFKIKFAIKTLAYLKGQFAEKAIVAVGSHKSALVKNAISYYSLISSKHIERSNEYKHEIYNMVIREATERDIFKKALLLPLPKYLHKEVQVKLHLASLRCLYWYGAYINPVMISTIVPLFREFNPSVVKDSRQIIALELLNSLAPDTRLKKIFSNWEKKLENDNDLSECVKLDTYIEYLYNYQQGRTNMDIELLNKLIFLREVSFFDKLGSDILYYIAEQAKWRELSDSEVLFLEGDKPDGIFIIASGKIVISSKQRILNTLNAYELFGEIGVINNKPRTATATAVSDTVVLFIDQMICQDLIEEFPEILKIITEKIIEYLIINKGLID